MAKGVDVILDSILRDTIKRSVDLPLFVRIERHSEEKDTLIVTTARKREIIRVTTATVSFTPTGPHLDLPNDGKTAFYNGSTIRINS